MDWMLAEYFQTICLLQNLLRAWDDCLSLLICRDDVMQCNVKGKLMGS
jgi:hypothetical protein